MLFRVRHASETPADYQIMVQPLPTGKPRSLVRGVYARYSPSGHLVVVTSEGKLLAIPFDPGKMELTGAPIGLYEGLEPSPFGAEVALSATGTLVFQTASQASDREVVWVTREGLASRTDSTWKMEGTINSLSLSPTADQWRWICCAARSRISG